MQRSQRKCKTVRWSGLGPFGSDAGVDWRLVGHLHPDEMAGLSSAARRLNTSPTVAVKMA